MIVWTLFAMLCLACGAMGYLGFQLEKANAKIAWLYAQPLSYWESVHLSRRMLEYASRAMLKGSDRLLATFGQANKLPAESETVTFRRPPPFKTQGY